MLRAGSTAEYMSIANGRQGEARPRLQGTPQDDAALGLGQQRLRISGSYCSIPVIKLGSGLGALLNQLSDRGGCPIRG
ncbi:hypothetical protein D3C84_1235300 [compost metagenome]